MQRYLVNVSPETYLGAQAWTSDVREVVDRFYAGLREGDRAALDELVGERFSSSVVVREPPTSPVRGDYEGPAEVARWLSALLDSGPADALEALAVGEVIESVGDPDYIDHIVVELTIPLSSGTESRALAWWRFANLRVAEVRTFYWDLGANAR